MLEFILGVDEKLLHNLAKIFLLKNAPRALLFDNTVKIDFGQLPLRA